MGDNKDLHQIKKMQLPTATPQMQISSNSGMRPPGIPVTNLQPNGTIAHYVSPPHPLPIPIPQHSPPNGVNGVSQAAITMPHVDVQKPEVVSTPAITNGMTSVPQMEPNAEITTNSAHLGLGVSTNGYYLTQMPGVSDMTAVNSASFSQHNQAQQLAHGLSPQQVQNLRTMFASSMPNITPNLAAFQAKSEAATLSTDAMAQWSHPVTTVYIPVQSPSANGSRPVPMRNGVHINSQHSMSPHIVHSPSPLPNISQLQLPPRLPMMPNMGIASPSLQQQQPVGGTQSIY
ncbi:hypothetical protein CPB84DRAFT_1851784 [Gymnopilus junonius]|uniref:Uncharacterized protein n=1 Tax=Gymnopilus junonius TaxID=109634 RepID=A0A9P5NFH6_GYMJU|nr:hypothetical protein CPB84DRAFT_1851784 [Gymnopilus junonius]